MFLCRLALSRSTSLSRGPANASICYRLHLDGRPTLSLLGKVQRLQFFSAALRNAGVRSSRRPQLRPILRLKPSPPSPPKGEKEIEYKVFIPERQPEDPGSGLTKLFLVIAVPIMLLSQADEIARFCVPPDEVRQALNLDPNSKPSPAAYDYYINNNKPDLARWLRVGQAMRRNFSFVPVNFTGNSGEPTRWWTLLTSEFNHGGLLHFFCCYTALKAFMPPLVQLYGSSVTAVCFVTGGVMAHSFVGFYEGTTNPFMVMSPAEVKRRAEVGFTKEEKRLHNNAYTWHLGSSSSLMTIGTICAIVCPTLRLNLMFIPIGIPIRALLGAFVVFDLGGMIWGYGLPIGHSGHIGGAAAGLLLYRFWVRKLPTTLGRYVQ